MSDKPDKSPLLVADVKTLIAESKKQVAVSVNTTMTLLYWQVGHRIHQEILKAERAAYGQQVVAALASELTLAYGRGWSKRQLHHCIRFAEVYSDIKIVHTLCTQLSWSHFRLLIPIEDPLKREFYSSICTLEKWSVRLFKERINSMLYERTAISKKPNKTIKEELKSLQKEQQLDPDLVFRDPYVLDFLGLSDKYSERDLEDAILTELQHFIIELGSDFAFMARQRRISIDHRDYYIDLLFYHRRLKCLVVIDLKIGEFEASYKGQLELYLRYLEKHDTIDGENKPVGLILCTGKNQEHIELLQLDKSNIKVAEYLTLLPPKAVLEQKLHKAIEIAKAKTLKSEHHD